MWITPKTDWEAQDYLDLETDFSRIEGNIHEILLIIRRYGYSLELDEQITWNRQDMLTSTDYNRIVGNIGRLEDIVVVPPDLPMLSEKAPMSVLNYTDMNILETHIASLKAVLDGMVMFFIPCGITQCGNRPVLPVASALGYGRLYDNTGAAILDRTASKIMMENHQDYTSDYTGAQMDELAEQGG